MTSPANWECVLLVKRKTHIVNESARTAWGEINYELSFDKKNHVHIDDGASKAIVFICEQF